MQQNMLDKNALVEFVGPLKDFAEKLSSVEGPQWFAAFKRYLRKENPWDPDFFRETGEVTIQIPALPRPTIEELQEKFSWIKSIERDTSSVEAIVLNLGTVLCPNEERIDSTEYERRIAPKLAVSLGYQHARWLVEHQGTFPDFMALLGKIYIDFPGLVVVGVGGDRHFPCLDRDGRRWVLHWLWVGRGLDRSGRVALSSK